MQGSGRRRLPLRCRSAVKYMQNHKETAMRLSVVAFAFLFVAGAQEPADMDTSYQNLQKALADKNAAQVKKLAVQTSAAAKQVIASPAPQTDAEKDTWTKQVKYAKEVQSYAEYALYTMAVE